MEIETEMSCVDIKDDDYLPSLNSNMGQENLVNDEEIKTETGGAENNEKTLSAEGTADVKMSKSQIRKLKRQEKWLAHKDEKRAKERLKKKQRHRAAIERGESLGPTRKKLKQNTMAKSLCKVKVVIDCSLDSYMTEKDIIKLVKQIQFCYSANRRADNPLQFYVCGVKGQTKDRLEAIGDFKNWDVHFTEEDYTEVFNKSSIVYLSSESPNVLHDLDPDAAYIIGGLVDHNHHKGLCHQKAVEKGISHAQLPLSEYIQLKSRKVLTINHVFEILLHYTESKDWQKSFFSVLPQRKGVQVKDNSTPSEVDKVECEKILQNGVLICPPETLTETGDTACKGDQSSCSTENKRENVMCSVENKDENLTCSTESKGENLMCSTDNQAQQLSSLTENKVEYVSDSADKKSEHLIDSDVNKSKR